MWLAAELIFTLAVAAGPSVERVGYVYRENGRYFFAQLPDGWTKRYEITWARGGLPPGGACYRDDNPHCPAQTLLVGKVDEVGRRLRDARLVKK